MIDVSKISKFLFTFAIFFGFYNFAFASTIPTMTSVLEADCGVGGNEICVPNVFIMDFTSFSCLSSDNSIVFFGDDLGGSMAVSCNPLDFNYLPSYLAYPSGFWVGLQKKSYPAIEISGGLIGNPTYEEAKLLPEFIRDFGYWDFSQNLKSGVLFGKSGESQQAIQGGGNMLSAVGSVSTNTFASIFPYLMLSAGVFLVFYIIQRIVILWGSASGEKINFRKAQWTGKGVMEHDERRFKKRVRSRLKRDLE